MFENMNANVRVLSFILTQTGTYQDQHLRPFMARVEAHHIDTLSRTTNNGRSLNVSAVQDVAGEIVRPQAETEGVAGIAEGWRSRRFRFMMVVEESIPFMPHDRTRRVFFGYTDHCDASINHLDPRMRIYFNSETVIKDFIRPTPNGPVHEARVVGSNQIVSPLDLSGQVQSAYHASPTTYLIRPEDVFSMGQTMEVVRNLESVGRIQGPIDMTYDSRAMVGRGGAYKYSARRDTSPTRYLSDTLNAYQHALKESEMMQDEDDHMDRATLYGTAQARAANHDIHSNTFIARLKDHAGFMERGFVTLSDLYQTFPETRTDQVTRYSLDDGRSIRRVSDASDSMSWDGSDHTTIGASLLAQVVPSVMMDNFFRVLSFSATNGMGLDQYVIDIHPDNSRAVVDGLVMRPYFEEFQRRLIVDALGSLSNRNQRSFAVSMICDLAGESIIDITLDGAPVVRYVAPTFSDSLFAPVITRNETLPKHISEELLYLVQEIVPGTAEQVVMNSIHPHSTAPQYQATQPAYPGQPSTQPLAQGAAHDYQNPHAGPDYSGLL